VIHYRDDLDARVVTEVRSWPVRYELLDGLRGVACVGVLLTHLGALYVGHYFVMVFFVISGYCITASARAAIRAKMPYREFMWRRVRRIYPPYLAAVLLFALTRLAKVALNRSTITWHASPLQWLQNLTLTQWVTDLWHPVHLPGDNPTLFVAAFWSLNYEEQFYVVAGLALFMALQGWFELRRMVIALMVIGFTWDFFHSNGPITGVFLEYWPHFGLGACLFFVLTESESRWTRRVFIVAVSLLGIVSIAQLQPWHGVVLGELTHRVSMEFAVLSVFSLMLLALRPFSSAIACSPLWRPLTAIGLISYSLYLVHQFNLVLVASIVSVGIPASAPMVLQVTAKVCVHLILATGFWFVFERPCLNRQVTRGKTRIELEQGMA